METKQRIGRGGGGAISAKDRRAYRAVLVAWGSDAKWGRPTERTAEAVWELLAATLPCLIDDLRPKSKSRAPASPEEILTAQQSLVVALDCAVSAAAAKKGKGAKVTFNRLFDALARRWSISYRQAMPATVSYDMAEETLKAAHRELMLIVRLDTLSALVAHPWGKVADGVELTNPLYSVWTVGGKGYPRGVRVRLRHGSDELEQFDRAVLADRQYRRRVSRRLLLAEHWKPRKRHTRQEICAGTPHNVVHLEDRSRRTLRHLEAARVRFNIDAFRRDYAEALARHDDDLVNSYRSIWLDTAGLTGVYQIRSHFFRAVNRRYHAQNFWPENVPKQYRAAWFGVETAVLIDGYTQIADDEFEPNFLEEPYLFVDLDISSSQTQILAVFLGLDELEQLARSTAQKFKVWLAERLWALHEQTPGGLLEVGYEGVDDRLVEFAKNTWMRFLYGSPFDEIARDLGEEPEKYGPGWKTRRGLDAKAILTKKAGGPCLSGAMEAKLRAQTFMDSLPEWRIPLQQYLETCRSLNETDGGVVFHDPWDGAEIRWNPAQRAPKQVPIGKHQHVEVRPWGELVEHQKMDAAGRPVRDAECRLVKVKRFEPLPVGTIDRDALRTMVAPCLIHTLDAAFSSLVIDGLTAAGVTNFVAIHDGWWVPNFIPLPAGDDADEWSGEAALSYAIEEAGRPWLESLAGIYETLDGYLGNDPTHGPLVREIRARWLARVARADWPKFTAG